MLQMIEPILQTSLNTVAWIPLYTLLSGMSTILWSPGILSRTGPRPAGYINLFAACVGFTHSLLACWAVWGQPAQSITLTWLNVADLQLILPLDYSSQSLGAIAVITGLYGSLLLATVMAIQRMMTLIVTVYPII